MVTRNGFAQFAADISRGYSVGGSTSAGFSLVEVVKIVLDEGETKDEKEAFNLVGGWNGIGTIFYKGYAATSNSNSNEGEDPTELLTAVPFDSNIKHYPRPGEVVLIIRGPSYLGKTVDDLYGKSYYLGPFNVWNNSQLNSLSSISPGKYFNNNSDIRPLRAFEGDIIIQGRKNNGIRFGSTIANLNEWSAFPAVGNEGDPIMILVNGYITTDTGSLSPNIEEVNKEMSSIYMTSTQKIPLKPDRIDILNPRTKPLLPQNYFNGSQIILNSDRVTLNSKKDEVMIFAKTNVEISTNNIINLNSKKRTHINSPMVFLGTKQNGKLPTEPILLGNQTVALLTDLLKYLGELGNALTQAVSSPLGGPIPTLNTAGPKLVGDLKNLQNRLKNIVSSNTFTT